MRLMGGFWLEGRFGRLEIWGELGSWGVGELRSWGVKKLGNWEIVIGIGFYRCSAVVGGSLYVSNKQFASFIVPRSIVASVDDVMLHQENLLVYG